MDRSNPVIIKHILKRCREQPNPLLPADLKIICEPFDQTTTETITKYLNEFDLWERQPPVTKVTGMWFMITHQFNVMRLRRTNNYF